MDILIFAICSLINVMLSTTKSILTIKSTRTKAAIINAITFGFYAVVIKQLTQFDLIITVAVTMCTNLIGVWLSLYILDKIKKDDLWKISVTCNSENEDTIRKQLKKVCISYNCYAVFASDTNSLWAIDIFSKSQMDSIKIKEILEPMKLKYHVIKVNHQL